MSFVDSDHALSHNDAVSPVQLKTPSKRLYLIRRDDAKYGFYPIVFTGNTGNTVNELLYQQCHL